MAIPKTLKTIPADKAISLIRKHLKSGTGEFDYPDAQRLFEQGERYYGDFCYGTGKYHTHLIRQGFCGFETGKIAN